MKLHRDRVEFFMDSKGGINCFYKDIFKLKRHRNLIFFIRHVIEGIKLERKGEFNLHI